MSETIPQRARGIFERLVSSYNNERDPVIQTELVRIKMEFVRQGVGPQSSGELGLMRDARQTEMNTRGMEIVAILKRVVAEVGVEPYPNMDQDLKALLHLCLRATHERLSIRKTPGGSSWFNETIGVHYTKYEAEIDLFIESLRRDQRNKRDVATGPIHVEAKDGSVVVVQAGGVGNSQAVKVPEGERKRL